MGKCAGNIVVAVAVLLSIFWLIVICVPTGWQTKATLVWNFHVGLYYVKVDRGPVGMVAHLGAAILDFGASKITKKQSRVFGDSLKMITEGEESLRFYRDMFCNTAVIPVLNMSCAPWEHLLIGSWVMLLTTIMTIILLLSGAAFMYYYVHHNTRTKVRKWAMGLLTSGAIVNLMGLGAYTGLSFNFGHWLAELMLSSSGATYSFVYVLALMLHLFTWTPVLIACTCAKAGEAEDIAEDMAWERKKLLYGFDDEYGNEDQYDEYGNPRYDEYGNPLPQMDQYGNPVTGSYHVSAYAEHDMNAPYGSNYGADPYAAQTQGSYHSYHDPYAQPIQTGSYGYGQQPGYPAAPGAY
jgi:hypothetical protein